MKGNGYVHHIKESCLQITALIYTRLDFRTPSYANISFIPSISVMIWGEEQEEKSDILLSTARHSIVHFGIRGAGFGSYYLKLLEQYTISKQSMTYQLCYEFPLSKETKDYDYKTLKTVHVW